MVPYETYQQVYHRVLEATKQRHPHAARFPDLILEIAEHDAYTEWRAQRVYDHTTVTEEQKENAPTGRRPRVYLNFHNERGTDGKVTVLALTEPEAAELMEQLTGIFRRKSAENAREAAREAAKTARNQPAEDRKSPAEAK